MHRKFLKSQLTVVIEDSKKIHNAGFIRFLRCALFMSNSSRTSLEPLTPMQEELNNVFVYFVVMVMTGIIISSGEIPPC